MKHPPLILLLVCTLTGCATLPRPSAPPALFSDAAFAPAPALPGPGDIFATSPAMRAYLDRQIADRVSRKGPRLGLMDALSEDLRIEYDAGSTRNAAEAFDARSGNCLSLVILTATLARELNIPVTYQMVYGQDTWSRASGIQFRSSHVNLVLGTRGAGHWRREPDRPLTVDFLPPEAVARFATRAIPEATVVAMFYNNRAAELLADGETVPAYWWARQAVLSAPSFAAAYNTLGVIYRRHGRPAEAERALRHVLEREPANVQALTNLAAVVASQGRGEEAKRLKRQLATISRDPPFHYYDLGFAALKRGAVDEAIALFRKELARMPYDDEVHFMLALARLRQGELRDARRHVALALENSPTRERSKLYAAKLDHLRTVQVN